MATMLYRQESEVANELRLALEEACLELGVSLSSTLSPSALWLLDASQEEPSLADLAGWLSITRRRSYRPSPLNKYRKYSIDDGGSSQVQEEVEEDGNVEVVSLGDGSEAEAPQELRLKERLSNAVELDVLAKDFAWNNLLSVHRTEHVQSEEDEGSDTRDSIGSIEVTVNSGGVVYFALFRNGHVESENHGSQESETKSESAAVFKFGSSRLATQSERLGIEIARHLGVATPQARAIHSNSSEWIQIRDSVQTIQETAEAEDNEIGQQTCEELLEALRLSRCMIIMGFIRGKPLAESKQAFSPEKVAVKTACALGRTLVLDMVVRNEDRLVCHSLGWRGNPGNLLVTEDVPHGVDKLGPPLNLPVSLRQKRTQSFTALSTSADSGLLSKVHRAPSPKLSHVGTADFHSLQNLLIQEDSETLLKKEDGVEELNCLLVAIDSGVARRPPGMKVEHDRRMYSKTIELLLHDEETAANLLREISFGFMGPPFENEPTDKTDIDHQKVTRAFQRGLIGAIRDMQTLRMFLVKLFRTLDHNLREFMGYVSSQSDTSKKQESSPVKDSVPTVSISEIDSELSKKLEWWDEKLRSEGQKLCREHSFTTGFLEGGGSHSLVDSYELKVRLEHILERMTMISNGADTEKPSCVISPNLYIGSALAARSIHTLQHVGITHILCLCPSDLVDANVGDFPDLFTYKNLAVRDVEDENIAAHFEDACSFIEQAEKEGKTILVHCFEGKSRSAAVVLAYLMLRKNFSLAQAWSILKTAHQRTQPNDGFMKTLVELDRKLHGKASMSFLKRRPAGQNCPICNKLAGLSLVAVNQHIRRVHPGVSLPLYPPPNV